MARLGETRLMVAAILAALATTGALVAAATIVGRTARHDRSGANTAYDLGATGSPTTGPPASPRPTTTPSTRPPSTQSAPASPTDSPSVPAARRLRSLPTDLSLTDGYPETNGDDQSPVVTTREPGVDELKYCGSVAWSAADKDVVELRGATYTGEAEDWRERTLALYADEASAAAALTRIRDAVIACPTYAPDEHATVVSDLDPVAAADEAISVRSRYATFGMFGTALDAVYVVRVGPLLLVDFTANEGGASPRLGREWTRRQMSDARPIVDDLGRLVR